MIFLKSQNQQGSEWSGKVVNWIGIGLDVMGELTEAELDWVVGGTDKESKSSEEFTDDAALAAAVGKCGDDPKAARKCYSCLKNTCYKHYENRNADELTKCVTDAACKK